MAQAEPADILSWRYATPDLAILAKEFLGAIMVMSIYFYLILGISMRNGGITLNVRLLAVVLAVGTVFCVGVFFLHRFQLDQQADFFLGEARSAAEELDEIEDPLARVEKLSAVTSQYRRYLIQRKDDLEVEKEFALLCYDAAKSLYEDAAKESDPDKRRKIRRFASGFYGTAVYRLEEVLRTNTDQPELRAKIADIFFNSGNWTSAIDHIKFLCKQPSDTVELAKIFDRFDLWKRLSPPLADGQDRTAALDGFFSNAGKRVDSEKLLEFLGADLWMLLDDPDLLSTYASCQAAKNQKDVAERALEEAIRLSPEDTSLYEKLAIILITMKPACTEDADYWMNEMVVLNPNSFRAKLMRGRYWNMVARSRAANQRIQIANRAVHDAVGAMQGIITIIADEADRQAPTLPETKALKDALRKLPEKPPSIKTKISPEYRQALLGANKASIALKENIEGISEEIDACRDGLLLAAQAEWLKSWLDSSSSGNAAKDDGKHTLANARIYAESLVSLYPAYSYGYAVLSEIDVQSGERARAIATLRKGSKVSGDNAGLLWRLAALLIDGGQIEEAKQVCLALEDENAEQSLADHLMARIAFSEGQWLAAAEGLEAVRNEVVARWPSHAKKLDFMLAECYGRLGRIDQQRDAYFRAASTDKTWLPALMGIAATKAKVGQIDGAIEDYRLILRLHKAPKSTAFELVRLLTIKNLRKSKNERNWTEVAKIIKSLEEAKADPLRIALLRADVYFSQGKGELALKVLYELQEHLEEEENLLQTQLANATNKAETLSGKEQEAARAEVDKLQAAGRKNAASQAGAWTAVANIAKRKKDWETAEQALLAARGKVGSTVAIRLAQGEHLLAQVGEKAAEPLRSLAGDVGHFSKDARLRLWRGLAGLSLRAGDYGLAKLLSRSVLRDEPGNRKMQIVRFEIAVKENDMKTIESILAEIEKDEESPGAFWHYGQAMRLHLLARNGNTKLLNKAQSQVEEALKIRPNWTAARLLAATLHDRQGNREAAAESYRKAIDLGAQSSAVIRRTVQLLAGLNRFREADEILRILGDRQTSLAGEADIESSIIKARIGEYDDAVVFAQKAAEESEKASDHMWLGQLLSIMGRRAQNQKRLEEAEKKLDEAEMAFEKAVALEPASDIAWVAIIQFYGQTGQIAKAEAAIEKARAELPPQKAAVAIAQCYEAIGKKQSAEKQLQENLAKSPRDAMAIERLAAYYIRNKQEEKAVEQLQKILNGKSEADPDQKAKARRQYASILFQQGGESNRKRALALIESNIRLNAASQADQYAKAVLLANDLSALQRKKAIPVLEKLLAAQHSPSAEIQFTLAGLYLSEKQMLKFKDIMRDVLRGEGKEPRYLSFYINSLIDGSDLKEAGIYLELLKKSHPDALATRKLEAKFAFQQKNYETATTVLENFLDLPQGDKRKQMRQLAEVAVVLAGFAAELQESNADPGGDIAKGFNDKAESIYQEFVDMQAGRELLMARFLAKQGRLKKAIKLAEYYAVDSSAEDIAATCFTFLQGTSPNADQLRRIDQVLNDSLDKHASGQDAVFINTALAILRDFQERYSEAETIYRDILEVRPDNPTAMNNLALLLALHGQNLDEADEMINKAIRDNGRLPGLLDTRAMVYLAQKQPKKALDDLSLAIKKQPTPVRYFHQAQAYFQDGQKIAAVNSLEKAHKMGLKENALIGGERRNYRRLQRALR